MRHALSALMLCACGAREPALEPTNPEPTTAETTAAAAPEATRVVAIGDVHGDLAALRGALRLAGAIDANDAWVGGTMTVVQVGDQLDRGDDEPEVLALLERLQGDASAAGGTLVVLDGNHELMNVAGDLRYVTPNGMDDYGGPDGRKAAFAPGSVLARQLARRPLHAIVGDTLFAHGGVLPAHLDTGLDVIEREADAWLEGKNADTPRALGDSNSLVWTRAYGGAPDEVDCAAANAVLERLGLKRMVVAHTVQPHINSVCDGRVWRVDVGLSKHYGGPREVLVIEGDAVRVVTE